MITQILITIMAGNFTADRSRKAIHTCDKLHKTSATVSEWGRDGDEGKCTGCPQLPQLSLQTKLLLGIPRRKLWKFGDILNPKTHFLQTKLLWEGSVDGDTGSFDERKVQGCPLATKEELFQTFTHSIICLKRECHDNQWFFLAILCGEIEWRPPGKIAEIHGQAAHRWMMTALRSWPSWSKQLFQAEPWSLGTFARKVSHDNAETSPPDRWGRRHGSQSESRSSRLLGGAKQGRLCVE